MSIESKNQIHNSLDLESRIVRAANSSTNEIIELANEALQGSIDDSPNDSLARWHGDVCRDYAETMRLGAFAAILTKHIDEATPVETENAVRAAVAEALGLHMLEGEHND